MTLVFCRWQPDIASRPMAGGPRPQRGVPGQARDAHVRPVSASIADVPAGVAQMAERPPCKRQVSGSIPLTGSRSQEVR